MNHQKYKEWIHLSLYGELNKGEQAELDRHLSFCSECIIEFEAQKRFKSFLSNQKFKEVDEDFLNETRLQLRNALREERLKISFWGRLAEGIKNLTFNSYQIAFGGIALLLIGLTLGYLFFSKSKEEPIIPQQRNENVSAFPDDAQITNVRFIDQDASDGEVEFVFDAVKPMHVKGNINDDKIKNVLMYSMLNEQNPGIRLNSINMINTNEKVFDPEIKEAIVNVVKYDKNPGVRREAFKLLNKFAYDQKIKSALLYVLINDENSGLRIEAINSLLNAKAAGHTLDENELSIFKDKLKEDKNNYIRIQARNVIEENKQK